MKKKLILSGGGGKNHPFENEITWLRLMHFSFWSTMHHRWESFPLSAINVFIFTFMPTFSTNCSEHPICPSRGKIFSTDVDRVNKTSC